MVVGNNNSKKINQINLVKTQKANIRTKMI